jgi:hypothetical protein
MLLAIPVARLLPVKALEAMPEAWENLSQREKARVFVIDSVIAMTM